MTTETKDAALGRVLGGQYRIDTLLGQGGMGRVYRGVQLSVNREVAIKLIVGDSPNQAELVKRFRREARATARLSHPNTVRLFDFGVTETQELYMVMELLEGRDLEEQLRASGALPLPVALHITRQILSALSEAHALGIVHRDLKPGNVFLSQVRGGDTIAKVMDFGVAGIEQARETQKLTTTGAVIGTPAYMSPEQAQGKAVDARSDLYSLGIMLYEMLAGRPPFEAESVVSLLLLHVTQPAPRLTIVTSEHPQLDAVQALLDRLLFKTPDGRPASAAEALAEVDRLLAREQGSRLPGVYNQGIAAAQISSTVQAQTPLTWEESQKSSGALALLTTRFSGKQLAIAAGAAATVLAAGGYWAIKPSKPAPAVLKPAAAAKEPASSEVHTVTIASTPSGARVLLGGADLGTTPYALKFRRDTEVAIVLQGYVPQTFVVTPNSDPNIVVPLAPQPAVNKGARAVKATTLGSRRVGTSRNVAAMAKTAAAELNPKTSPAETIPPASSDSEPAVAPRSVNTQRSATSASQRSPVGEVTHAIGGLVSSIFGSGDSEQHRRRDAMRNRPPPYPNEAAAKRALNAGEITSQQYSDAIWVLRAQRQQRIAAEKANLRAGKITSQEYKRRVQRINAQ